MANANKEYCQHMVDLYNEMNARHKVGVFEVLAHLRKLALNSSNPELIKLYLSYFVEDAEYRGDFANYFSKITSNNNKEAGINNSEEKKE